MQIRRAGGERQHQSPQGNVGIDRDRNRACGDVDQIGRLQPRKPAEIVAAQRGPGVPQQVMPGKGTGENKTADNEEDGYTDATATEEGDQAAVPGPADEGNAAPGRDLRDEMEEHHKRNSDETEAVNLRDPGGA